MIGLGAIGGSLAWGARRWGVPRVVGFTPDPADAEAAVRAGAVSALARTPETALSEAELVVLAAPPASTIELIRLLAPRLPPGVTLTDVASVKQSIVAEAVAAGLETSFAGGHPLAGTHQSGFAGATPDLLEGCVVYICPTAESGGAAACACRVADFWTAVFAASPAFIDASEHDRQLAWTSHLPQAVAYALAGVLAARGVPPQDLGPGARDTTRLAASSPELWIDIFLQNRDGVLPALDAAGAGLRTLRDLVERRDEAGLRSWLASAADFRRGAAR